MAHYYTFPVMEMSAKMESISVDHRTLASHPALNHYLKTRNQQVQAISDIVSEQNLHRIEPWYTDYFQHFGIKDELGFILEMPSAPEFSAFHRGQDLLALVLCRDRRNFTEHDRLLLSLVQPHLKQAYENVVAFNHLQHQLTQQDQATEQAGIIVLSVDGNFKWMTQRAGTLLHHYFPPSEAHISLPDLLQRWVKQHCSDQAQTGLIPTPPSPLRIERNSSRLTVRLSYEARTEQVYLLLEETQLERYSPKSLEILGLTKRETEVLFWVAKDQCTKKIAKNLGISDRTVKKHLEHIYEKLGVQTRTGAVMYVLEKSGILNA
jgi:DNA-binding CsgD family transcriptional regulator